MLVRARVRACVRACVCVHGPGACMCVCACMCVFVKCINTSIRRPYIIICFVFFFPFMFIPTSFGDFVLVSITLNVHANMAC